MSDSILVQYFDDAETQLSKGYIRVLFKPGVPVQTRELNNIISYVQDQVAKGFSAIWKRNAVIKGCDWYIAQDDKFYINDGFIFWNNYLLQISNLLPVTVDPTDTEVGFYIKMYSIGVEGSSADNPAEYGPDNDLGDNASGFTNVGAEGADRLLAVVQMARRASSDNLYDSDDTLIKAFVDLDDTEGYITFKKVNNIEVTEPETSSYSDIGRDMAQRTFDESGNYVVDGMEVYIDENDPESDGIINDITIGLRAGVAYVNGYRIDAATDVAIERVTVSTETSLWNIPLIITPYTITGDFAHMVQVEDDFIYQGATPADIAVFQPQLIHFLHETTSNVSGIIDMDFGADREVVDILGIYDNTGAWVSSYTWDSGGDQITGLAASQTFYIMYYFERVDGIERTVYDFAQDVNFPDRYHYDFDIADPVDKPYYKTRLVVIKTPTDVLVEDTVYNDGTYDFYVIKVGALGQAGWYLVNVHSDGDLTPGAAGTADLTGATFMWLGSNTATTYTDVDGIYWGAISIDRIDYSDFISSVNRGFLVDGNIRLSYNYVLGRTDGIYLNSDGILAVIQGIPIKASVTNFPNINDTTMQLMGLVKQWPNIEVAGVREVLTDTEQIATKRLTMQEINVIKGRVDDLEEDIATLALETQTKDENFSSALRGILVDNFDNFDRVNLGRSDTHFALDLDENTASLPINRGISVDDDDIFESNPTLTGVVTETESEFWYLDRLPVNDVTRVEVTNITGLQLLNGYVQYKKSAGRVWTRPNKDHWISNIVRWRSTITRETTVWVQNSNFSWTWRNGQGWIQQRNAQRSPIERIRILKRWERVLPFCRPLRLQMNILNWIYMPDLVTQTQFFVRAYIDDKPMEMISRSSGVYHQTVPANGTLQEYIFIPTGVNQGRKKIVFRAYADSGDAAAGNANFFAERNQSYDSRGKERITIARRMRTVFVNRVRSDRDGGDDPLAQGFIFDEPVTLTKATVYLFNTGNLNLDSAVTSAFPVHVSIGNMIAGLPGDEIWAEKTLPHTLIDWSYYDQGSNQYILNPVEIEFPEPVYIPAKTPFCITLLSDSTDYTAAIAELGSLDLNTQKTVELNPYLAGTLFASSNNVTWTAFQDRDITMKIYVADEFVGSGANTGTLEFARIDTCSRFLFASEIFVPDGTDLQFQFKYHRDSDGVWTEWENFEPNQELDLNEMAREVRVLVTMISLDGSHTPLMSKNHSFITSKYIAQTAAAAPLTLPTDAGTAETSLGLVTRLTENIGAAGADNYLSVKCIVDVYLPNPTNDDVRPCFAYVDPTTEIEAWVGNDFSGGASGDVTMEDILEGWKRYTFQFNTTGLAGKNATTFRGKIAFLADINGQSSPKLQNLRWILQAAQP